MIKLHHASIDWLRIGGLGSSTMGAKTIVVKNADGGVLKNMAHETPLFFAHIGGDPKAGEDVCIEITLPITGAFVRSELVESVSERAPLYYWVLDDIRREPEPAVEVEVEPAQVPGIRDEQLANADGPEDAWSGLSGDDILDRVKGAVFEITTEGPPADTVILPEGCVADGLREVVGAGPGESVRVVLTRDEIEP